MDLNSHPRLQHGVNLEEPMKFGNLFWQVFWVQLEEKQGTNLKNGGNQKSYLKVITNPTGKSFQFPYDILK